MKRAALLLAALATPASASPFGFNGGHLDYAVGGSTGGQTGTWHFLDVGFAFGWAREQSNRDGMLNQQSGTILSGAVITGFGSYPTYLDAEFGAGLSAGIAGLSGSLGLVARVNPDPTGGLGIHLTADFFFLQIGTRLMLLGTDTDFVGMFTVGFGRF